MVHAQLWLFVLLGSTLPLIVPNCYKVKASGFSLLFFFFFYLVKQVLFNQLLPKCLGNCLDIPFPS